jgi:hypothetical protein
VESLIEPLPRLVCHELAVGHDKRVGDHLCAVVKDTLVEVTLEVLNVGGDDPLLCLGVSNVPVVTEWWWSDAIVVSGEWCVVVVVGDKYSGGDECYGWS